MTEDVFAADWLALREGPDHAARDIGLATRLGEWMEQTGSRRVVDLGCGSGSTLRALTPSLPDGTVWTLIDHDEALLTVARSRLINWADSHAETGAVLTLEKDGKRIEVRLERRDLSADMLPDLFAGMKPEVLTASAFFDLAGAEFINAFAAAARDAGAAVHAALTYDGQEQWDPAHPADAEALAAFHAHMRRDKGLGPASGPDTVQLLERALKKTGYQVSRRATPWRLSASANGALIDELAEGVVSAVAEIAADAPWLEEWSEARSRATTVEIGHADILALP